MENAVKQIIDTPTLGKIETRFRRTYLNTQNEYCQVITYRKLVYPSILKRNLR